MLWIAALVLCLVPQDDSQSSGEEVVIRQLPICKGGSPRFVKTSTAAKLRLEFEEEVMNSRTQVTVSLRGAGFWDQVIQCSNQSPTGVSCPLPRFTLTGDVDLRVKFNASTITVKNPFLPIAHRFTVWDVVPGSLSPSVMPRSSTNKTVTVTGRGFFQLEDVNNLVAEVRGAKSTRLRDDQVRIIDAAHIQVDLPTDIDNGKSAIWVSVDGGNNFQSCDQCIVSIYEPSMDGRRLKVEPSGAPVSGGTEVTIHGVYRMMINQDGLEVKLQSMIREGNETRVHTVIATARSNDQLEPFVLMAENPVFRFVAPATLYPGYYSLSIGKGEYMTPLPLTFLYYDLNITSVQPISSIISNPTDKITFCAAQIPRTNVFQVRYGHRLTTPSGSTFTQRPTVVCDTQVTAKADKECVSCRLPETDMQPQKGTVLGLEVSANGIDFVTPPVSEFVYFDPSVVSMSPTKGPLKGQNITLHGHGFVDINGMVVKVSSKTSAHSENIPVQFVGEGTLEFSIPALFDPPISNQQSVRLVFLPTGDESVAVPLPDFVFDTVRPTLVSATMDSGSHISPIIAVPGNTVTIRLTFSSSVVLRVQNFRVGPEAKLPTVTAIDERASVHTLTYTIKEKDMGAVEFTVEATNVQGNSAVFSQLDDLVDKRITVDSSLPTLTAKFFSSNPSKPSTAISGDWIYLMLSSDIPLTAVQVNNFTVGDEGVPLKDVDVQTVGGFPSSNWKVQYMVPQQPIHSVGVVHFDVKAVTSVGNVLPSFTDLKVLDVLGKVVEVSVE